MGKLVIRAAVLTFNSSKRSIVFGCPQITTNARNHAKKIKIKIRCFFICSASLQVGIATSAPC